PNPNLSLWPGQFVNTRLLLTVRKDAAVVPASVIQRGSEGPYAFVIKADETVEMRPIKPGPTEDGQTTIDAGLTPGERIVVDGQYKLQNGSMVRLTPAAGIASGAGEGAPAGRGGHRTGAGPAETNAAGGPNATRNNGNHPANSSSNGEGGSGAKRGDHRQGPRP